MNLKVSESPRFRFGAYLLVSECLRLADNRTVEVILLLNIVNGVVGSKL